MNDPYGQPQVDATPPKHPRARTSMVLGIVGLASLMVCGGLLLVISPVAWVMGSRAVAEIDSSGGRQGGREEAEAGRVMGKVGTILLPFVVLGGAAYIALIVASASGAFD